MPLINQGWKVADLGEVSKMIHLGLLSMTEWTAHTVIFRHALARESVG